MNVVLEKNHVIKRYMCRVERGNKTLEKFNFLCTRHWKGGVKIWGNTVDHLNGQPFIWNVNPWVPNFCVKVLGIYKGKKLEPTEPMIQNRLK